MRSEEYLLILSEHELRCIVPFVYIGKEVIHKYMQYEVFMAVYMESVANQRKSYLMCTY